jgi:hypothetical protein
MKKYQIMIVIILTLLSSYLLLINNSNIELITKYNSSVYLTKYGKQGSGEAWKDCYNEIKLKTNNKFVGPEIPKIITTDNEFICYRHVI